MNSHILKPLSFNLRLALPALLWCMVVATGASAQEVAASSWIKVAPPDEAFTVMMPEMPSPVAEQVKSGRLEVEGQRYRVRQEDAEYAVWSFKPAGLPIAPSNDREAYLEQCAEIAWRVIIKPGWVKLKRESLSYDKSLSFHGLPGLRYRIKSGKRIGIADIYAVESKFYIVAAWGAARQSASVEEFIKSFTLNLPVPAGSDNARSNGIGNGDVREPGGGGHSRIFSTREVTQKAQILKMPEASYTEGAREFGVTGKVRLRIILWPSGVISNIRPIDRLPYGLTWQAIEAAQRIKFTPAMKDGRAVPQHLVVVYNFNIY
jgi:hypothetical protein